MEEVLLGENPLMQFLVRERIGFIGIGKMGTALLHALVKGGHQNIIVSRRNQTELDLLREIYGVQTTTDNREVIEYSQTVLWCVKPSDLQAIVAQTIGHRVYDRLWISIAAGKTLQDLMEILGEHARIIRTMPHLGTLVGSGCTAYAMNTFCGEQERAHLAYIFNKEGTAFEVQEEQLDAVTYVACKIGLLSKELEQDAKTLVKSGISDENLLILLRSVLFSTAELLKTRSYDTLYRQVASPKEYNKGATQTAHEYAVELGYYDRLQQIAERAIVRCAELRELKK